MELFEESFLLNKNIISGLKSIDNDTKSYEALKDSIDLIKKEYPLFDVSELLLDLQKKHKDLRDFSKEIFEKKSVLIKNVENIKILVKKCNDFLRDIDNNEETRNRIIKPDITKSNNPWYNSPYIPQQPLPNKSPKEYNIEIDYYNVKHTSYPHSSPSHLSHSNIDLLCNNDNYNDELCKKNENEYEITTHISPFSSF